MLGSSIRSRVWWLYFEDSKRKALLWSACVYFIILHPFLAWQLTYTFFYIIFPSRPFWSPCARFEPTPCTKWANTLAGNVFLYASRGLLPPVLVGEVSRQAPEHRSWPICASIEDGAYWGVKLHLAACRRWVRLGMMVLWVPYYCSAAVWCLSLPLLLLLLLLLFLLVSMFACACWCARSS